MAKQTVDDVLTASKAILKTGSGVAEIIGVPGVKLASDLLLALIQAIQNVRGNEGKRLEISKHISTLAQIVADVQGKISKNKNIYSRALEDRVMQLNSELVQYGQVASRLAAMRAPERLLRNEAISGALTDLANGVKMSCERTNTQALFNIELNQAHQGQVLDKIHETVTKSSKAEIDHSTSLPFANAAYDSINLDSKSEVLPGTRVAVMEQIDRWATSTCPERVFWLRGAAGTGKSTIAKSVAAKFDDRNRLGASFFFVQDVQDLGNTRLLISTIACHLARLDGLIGTAIKTAARKYAETQTPGQKSSWREFKDLLFEPLEHLEPLDEPVIIVLDALDEASDRDMVVSNLKLLATLSVNIKLFVTSRPDPKIESVLGSASLLILHDIEKTILDHDIKLYIEYAFREIREGFQYTLEDIQLLVDQAGGLFIYVSTVIKLLKGSLDPLRALQDIFKRRSDRMLDQLYLQVLERAFGGYDLDSEVGGNRDAWDERLRVLGTIVLTQDRNSCATLACLLERSTTVIRDALSHLEAVILVPRDDDVPVRILHASFSDFIVDANRCTNPYFAIKTSDHHSFLAEECIHHMNRLLVENPCKISDPYALNSDVLDLDERINEFLPLHLQYASLSWAHHLSLSTYSLSLKEQLRVFCKAHLLEWLEVMSSFGLVDLAIVHLDTAFKWIKSNNEVLPSAPKSIVTSILAWMEILSDTVTEQVPDDEVLLLLYDAYRFTLQFADLIVASARHLYVSALPLMPSCLLYRTYQTRIPSTGVKVHHRRDVAWQPYLRTLSGHVERVLSIASSKDGAYIVSGSEDKTLRVWDSATGTHLAQRELHSNLPSVAFSSDGTRVIASGDTDEVYVWDWLSGALLHWSTLPFKTFDSIGLGSIAAANTSNRFASFSPYRLDITDIKVWDLTGLLLNTLVGHLESVRCAAFSPDDSRIVSTCKNTMRLWNSSTGQQLMKINLSLKPELGPAKCSVSFSPDGHQIFSTSNNHVCVWDAQTGAKLRQRTIASTAGLIANITYSPDGTQFAGVGHRNGGIYVFDSSSGAWIWGVLQDVYRHPTALSTFPSTAFSPDGTRIFVGSGPTIRIWDLSVNYNSEISLKDENPIDGVAFSPDHTCVCTWQVDSHRILVWDLSTGHLFIELKGHAAVLSAVFSPDSTQIVSVTFSAKPAVCIWDLESGRQAKKFRILLQRQPAHLSVALSPDGTRVACGLYPTEFSYSRHRILGYMDDLRREVQSRSCPGSTAITFSPDGSHVYRVISSPLDIIQWDTRTGEVISSGDSEAPYSETELGPVPLLMVEKSWIVPVSNPSRKLFCIPVEYLPIQTFYAYGLFVVLVRLDKITILDFTHMASLISS